MREGTVLSVIRNNLVYLFRVFIFWDHLHDISTDIPKPLKGVEIHVLSHSATWAGSVEWTLLYFLTVLLPSLIFSLLIQFSFLYCRDSKAIGWGHYPNTQLAAQKGNIARNHVLATQRWTKDKKLALVHCLARSPPKSSSVKLTFTKKLDIMKGQPLRSQKISHPEHAHVSMLCYSHTSYMHKVGIGNILGSLLSVLLSVICNAHW